MNNNPILELARPLCFPGDIAVFLCNMMRENKVTIFPSLIYLYLYDLCPTNATYFGNYLWPVLSSWWQQLLGKPTTSGTKMEQSSVTLLPVGKPRAVDNMGFLFWGWHIKSSICVCWAVIESDATKNIQCNNR